MKEKDKKEIKSEEEKPKGIRISVVFGYREPIDLKILERLDAEFAGGLSKSGVIKNALYDHFFGDASSVPRAEKPATQAQAEPAEQQQSPPKAKSCIADRSSEELGAVNKKADALGDAF